MGINNEQLKRDNIKQAGLIDLARAMSDLHTEGHQIQAEMQKAFEADDIELLLAHGSALGVNQAQQAIIDREVVRRDEEDGPMSPEEMEDLQGQMMRLLLGKLIGGE